MNNSTYVITSIKSTYFRFSSKGYSSKEYTSAMQLTVGSTILGFFYGLLQKVPEAREQYLMANQQTRYLSAYEAGV